MASDKQQPDASSFYKKENRQKKGILDLQCIEKSQRTKKDCVVYSWNTYSTGFIPQKQKWPVVFWDLIAV